MVDLHGLIPDVVIIAQQGDLLIRSAKQDVLEEIRALPDLI